MLLKIRCICFFLIFSGVMGFCEEFSFINTSGTLMNMDVLLSIKTEDRKKIKNIDLSRNKIEKIENLKDFINLESLNLGYNRVKKIEGLSSLKKLKVLHLELNLIPKIEGLNELRDLEWLNVSGNRITKIEGLDNVIKLKYLNIANSEINYYENKYFFKKLENIKQLVNLEELNISLQKEIPDLNEIKNLKKLKCITFSMCDNLINKGWFER